MANEHWGECKACKMFQVEPDAKVGDRTMGHCVADGLETYQLRVSGNSGCNHFAHGQVVRLEGASAPPEGGH